MTAELDRFWSKVRRSDGCWLWASATRKPYGYGQLHWRGKVAKAHRVAYEIANGPIPDGLSVLHHCDTPACVRPDHLYLGTHADNMADLRQRERHGRWQAQKAECKHGHSLSGANLYETPDGRRQCRTCTNRRQREHYARKTGANT